MGYKNHDFRPISRVISEVIKDRARVTSKPDFKVTILVNVI